MSVPLFNRHHYFVHSCVCVSKQFMRISLLFHLRTHLKHLHFSNSCACVSKHVYAFPSSSILIHIYCHLHKYALCPVLYLYSFFCFLSSFFTNLIDTYVTVPIDVRKTLLICPDSFPSASSFLTYLPPHVHLCLHPNIYTYLNTSFCPFYTNLLFPCVFSYM